MKLLIADDQQSTHQFLDKMIDWTSLGVTEVHHAYHGKEAVDQMKRLSPDLMILDLRMPVLDGIGVLRETGHLPCKPKTIIISAYDEFEYARDAMKFGVQHYLLKPIDIAAVSSTVGELGEQVRREAAEQLSGFISKTCRLKTEDEETVQAINAGFRASGISGYYCVFIASPDGEAGKVLAAQAPDSCRFITQVNQTDVFIVHGITDNKLQAPDELARLYRSELPDGLTVGISLLLPKAEHMVTGLRQSEAAFKQGFYDGSGVYFYSEPVLAAEVLSRQETDELAKELLEKLEPGYSEQGMEKAAAALFAAFRRKRPEPAAVYQICYHLLFMTGKKLPSTGSARPFAVGTLEPYNTLDRLEAAFTGCLKEMIRTAEEPSYSADDTIRQIKQYVDTNYSGDLSLDTVSAKFIMNKYQLCRLFKREFAVSYWSYVTRVRMEKAAELLLYTAYKVAHIALKVGYPDESHFSNVFKKFYGVRPKEYKANNTQESSTTNQ